MASGSRKIGVLPDLTFFLLIYVVKINITKLKHTTWNNLLHCSHAVCFEQKFGKNIKDGASGRR